MSKNTIDKISKKSLDIFSVAGAIVIGLFIAGQVAPGTDKIEKITQNIFGVQIAKAQDGGGGGGEGCSACGSTDGGCSSTDTGTTEPSGPTGPADQDFWFE